MAYVLKYTSNFYNIYKKYVEVEISKWNYTTPVIPLRNTEVYIEVNYQDNNTPVIGTGCSIVVVNQGEFEDLEDLLTSTEKQFKCVVKYAGVTVFQGFSICDLNEQQFLPWSRIKLQFTDYLRRLEGHFAANFFIGANTDLLTLLQELIVKVGFGSAYELYVNSTLMETQMVSDGGMTKTFLPQTYVENNMYFSNTNTYDDVYVCINRTLNSFGAFIYSMGDKWVLERHEDILRDKLTSSWVKYTLYQVASNTPSLKEVYNKQAGDFNYVDENQVLTYESGLHTLILNLIDKAYDTFVFNDYDMTLDSVNDVTPDPGTLAYRTWYKYADIEILDVSYDYRDIGSYIKWTYPQILSQEGDYSHMGLYYAFQIQFNVTPEIPLSINVNFKMSMEYDLAPVDRIVLRYMLRVDGGIMDGLYLGYIDGPAPGSRMLTFVDDWAMRTLIDTSIDKNTKSWSINDAFNFTDTQSFTNPGGDSVPYPSLWTYLGEPTSQKFMIYFLPIEIHLGGGGPGFTPPTIYARINYLGDIGVTITQEKIKNKITYNVNEDFVKTEEIDIDFWDLDNLNYANGLMYGLGGIGNDAIGKTRLWTSELAPAPQELMDIYAKSKFRNYARTIHKLQGRIMHDGYMKPFSVLTDDNKPDISFILQGYTWDLNNGVYEIEAEEYTTEDIVIDNEGGGASSGGEDGDPGVTPSVPTNLTAVQLVAGSSVDISWDVSTGASGYILQRQPYYNGITWISSWKTVWEGYNAFTADPIQYEAIPPNSMHFSYRVLAKTTLLYSAYSATEVLIWTA